MGSDARLVAEAGWALSRPMVPTQLQGIAWQSAPRATFGPSKHSRFWGVTRAACCSPQGHRVAPDRGRSDRPSVLAPAHAAGDPPIGYISWGVERRKQRQPPDIRWLGLAPFPAHGAPLSLDGGISGRGRIWRPLSTGLARQGPAIIRRPPHASCAANECWDRPSYGASRSLATRSDDPRPPRPAATNHLARACPNSDCAWRIL
eukprot:scaffold2991_cov403-Prasinococcus_capsulatus_cf.AAC.20